MFTANRLLASSLIVLGLVTVLFAQNQKRIAAEQGTAPIVTASAATERVRFTAPGSMVQIQLEVFTNDGGKIFDSTQSGNVLDWVVQDQAGQRLPDGSYFCVVSVKSLAGKVSQKRGTLIVKEKQIAMQPADSAQLTAALSQSLAANPLDEISKLGESDTALTVVHEGEPAAVTTLAHDGARGEIGRSRGGLSFRLGDFFSGKDKEQMRLTEEGNLGIGTSKPQAKLDVSGDIRAKGAVQANKGIAFADGTVQTTGLSGRLDASGNVVPNASGTGTQNQLAKWTDNAGTLGNSIITESPSGFIGIGNTNPTAKLSVSASSGAELRFDQGAQGITPVLSVISQPSSTTQGAASILGAGTGGSSFVFSDNLPFFLVKDTKANVINNQLGFGTILFTILPTGSVGIGTTAPGSKLDVTGNINTSTTYNIGGNRVFSIPGVNNTFAGVSAGNANTTGQNLSFFGNNAGAANISGLNNAFFGSSAGAANTHGHQNSFFGYFAGAANTTGQNNAFFGEQAGRASTGDGNTFVGSQAGIKTNSASFNSFFGSGAGQNNLDGGENSFVGYGAGLANTSGMSNSFFGLYAGMNNGAGNSNVAIGNRAGVNLLSGSNNIYLANTGADESNHIRIGTEGTQTATFIAGINGINVNPSNSVVVNSSGQLGIIVSSRRYKKDIHDMGDASSKLMQLRPVTFLYRPEYVAGDQTLQYGLIAEEVAQLYPDLVALGADGKPQTVRYHLLNTMLLNEVQKQERQIHAQELQLKTQAQLLAELTTRLARVEAKQTARRHRRK